MRRKSTKYLILLGVFISLYIIAALNFPISPAALAKYDLTLSQARLLYFTIVIPHILIWLAAFYGFMRFKEYTGLIKDTADGRALNRVANGLMILAFSLPITRLVSALEDHIVKRSPELIPSATIVINYLTLALTLAGFVLIARGAKELTGVIKKQPTRPYKAALTLGFLALAGIFSYFTLSSPMRRVSSDPLLQAAYHLPDWLIVTTIIVPYLYIWYLGGRAAMHISFYKHNVSGHIYKPFLGSLAVGISWVIIASVLQQFFRALRDVVVHLSLRPLLLVVYVLLVITALGYLLIARAAQKLRKIEEV